jgi:predicted nucleic acid-binding protein
MAEVARGREKAEKRGLKVIGALGVIAAAHKDSLLDLAEAVGRRLNWKASWRLLLLEALLVYTERLDLRFQRRGRDA